MLAHINYERQRALKAEIIVDAFRRLGRITLDQPIAVTGSPVDGYRMRARLHVRGGRIGFFREGTHSLCEPGPTRQLRADTIDALSALERSLATLERPAVSEIELSENIDGDRAGASPRAGAGRRSVAAGDADEGGRRDRRDVRADRSSADDGLVGIAVRDRSRSAAPR